MSMHCFVAGQRSPIPASSPTYMYGDTGHMLILPVPNMTPAEKHSFAHRMGELAVCEFGPVGTLLFRFGDLPWSDAAFNVLSGGRLSQEAQDEITSSAVGNGCATLFTIVPVEANDGTVASIRVFAPSTHFSRVMLAVLNRQIAAGPVCDPEFFDRVEALYAQFPQSQQMVRRAIARCTVGAA